MPRDYGQATEAQIARVIEAVDRYGSRSIVALAGVPGTGKSFIAAIAAQRYARMPELVREIQFHQSFTYEEFIEGMRIGEGGSVQVEPGILLEWNEQARDDPDQRYVLLVEELTRANISAVLGELLTYLEFRDRPFFTVYSRRPVYVAPNLIVLATYNPVDRSALEVDAALLRRMRVISFAPDADQLKEMLDGRDLKENVIARLQTLFAVCRERFGQDFERAMPFGHGIFADVREEADLHRLWEERIRHMLFPPLQQPHAFASVIVENFPWRDAAYREPEGAGP